MAQITVNEVKAERKIFGMTLGSFLGRFGPLFGLIILVIFLSATSDVFLTGSNLSNIARQATVNAFLAIGLLLAIITGGIDLSVGSILAVAMCSMAILAIKWGVEIIEVHLSTDNIFFDNCFFQCFC